MKISITILLLLLSIFCFGQDTLKTMFYNLYRFPSKPPANREFILRKILKKYSPDLFMVCELESEEGADRILHSSLQTPQNNFARASFQPIQSVTKPHIDEKLQQIVFYNMNKLILTNQAVLTTSVRDINHYTFKLNTTTSNLNPIYLDVFVTHLKSSPGKVNRNKRLKMINTFITALKDIPKEHYVLFSGDFNFYDSDSEPGYQKIINLSNPIIMVDPIDMPGKWHDNASFSTIHTQATRTSAKGFGTGGAIGGLDDRFDFIMMSENFHLSREFYYTDTSYKAFGNNGNCLDQRINHEDCNGIYDSKVRQNLHDMSDHLPIVMEFQTTHSFVTTSIIEDIKELPIVSFSFTTIEKNAIYLKINTSKLSSTTKLSIFNQVGQNIKTIAITNRTANLKINIESFPKGIYYIKLDDYSSATLKFLKK